MKNILIFVSALLLVATIQQPTELTYFIEHQVQQQSDFIQIGVTVHCQEPKLRDAVKKASEIVERIKKIAQNYCNSNSKKSQCDDAVQASNYNIEPRYQLVRKVQTFMAFAVSYQITITVKKLDGIGKMTDSLLAAGEGLLTIDSFEWKAEQENNPQEVALKQGVQQGRQLCERMGLKLSHIISIQQVQEHQAEQQEQQEQEEAADQQEEQQQEEADVIVFKFDVECI